MYLFLSDTKLVAILCLFTYIWFRVCWPQARCLCFSINEVLGTFPLESSFMNLKKIVKGNAFGSVFMCRPTWKELQKNLPFNFWRAGYFWIFNVCGCVHLIRKFLYIWRDIISAVYVCDLYIIHASYCFVTSSMLNLLKLDFVY